MDILRWSIQKDDVEHVLSPHAFSQVRSMGQR
jgi:hypothetical protein